jgi:hypothetical protein
LGSKTYLRMFCRGLQGIMLSRGELVKKITFQQVSPPLTRHRCPILVTLPCHLWAHYYAIVSEK